MSLDSRTAIQSILQKRYSDVRITDVSNVAALDEVIMRNPGLVFLGVKFVPNDAYTNAGPVWLSQRLSSAGIACTGSSKAAFMLEHNKQLGKQQVRSEGLATADSILLEQGESFMEADISIDYPIFVKPVDGGGGSGINEHSLVHNFDELKTQVAWLMENVKTDALLESYLPGREFSVGILQEGSSDDFHAMPLEIVAPKNLGGSRFLSSRVKREDAEQTYEITDHDLKNRLSRFALSAFTALGAEGYGRIDVRMDADGKPHFLEANLLPSLLDNYGNLPKACFMNIGLGHSALILQIAALGLAKNDDQLSFDNDTAGYSIATGLQAIPA